MIQIMPADQYQNPPNAQAQRAGRRAVLRFGLQACALALPWRAHAGPTGIAALDSAAIPVKSPTQVVLTAIAQAGPRLVAAGEHGVIIYSDDNGASWQQAAVPVDVTLTCLTFISPQSGWAAGHFGVILHSADGGVSWVEQLNGIEANRLTLAAAENAATAAPNAPGTPLAMRRAAHFMQAGPANPFLTALALSPQSIIVFGAYRLSMSSTDGGQSWADASLRIGDRYSHNLYAAAVIGPDIFVAAEEGLVFRSTDGGSTFPQVTAPSSVTLFGITGTAAGNILVYGVAGTCYRSADRGETWQPVQITVQDNLTAGVLLPNGGLVLASEAGNLFLSHDDGQTFTPIAGLPPMAVSGMVRANDGALICAGQTGVARIAPASLLS